MESAAIAIHRHVPATCQKRNSQAASSRANVAKNGSHIENFRRFEVFVKNLHLWSSFISRSKSLRNSRKPAVIQTVRFVNHQPITKKPGPGAKSFVYE